MGRGVDIERQRHGERGRRGPDGSIAVTGSVGTNNRYAIVARLSESGALGWTARVQSGSNSVRAAAVSFADDGGIVIGGQGTGTPVNFVSASGATDVTLSAPPGSGFIARLDPTGTFQWASLITATAVGVNAVDATARGGMVVGGTFRGTVSFGSPSVQLTTGSPVSAGYVSRVGADGTFTQAVAIGTSQIAQVSDVAATPSGGALVVGAVQGGTATFGPGISVTPEGSADEGFIALQAPDGGFSWANVSRSTGNAGVVLTSVSLRRDGSAVAAGSAFRTGPGTTAFGGTVLPVPQNEGVVITGVSASGEFRWAATGGTQNPTSESYPSALSALSDGSTHLSGDFDSGNGAATFATTAISGSGDWNGFVAQALDVPVPPATPTPRAGERSATIAVTPIPGTAVTSYEVLANPGNHTCTITVPAAECAISGLVAGTPYTFTALAVNAAGRSAASAASAAVTPTAAPPPAPGPRPAVRPLGASIRCTGGRCTTTGPLPTGAARVTQVATAQRVATSLIGEDARRSATGRCTLSPAKVQGKTAKKRTYRCVIRLAKGRWTITTGARSTANRLMAQAVRAAVVR